jgi:hypothetical protein
MTSVASGHVCMRRPSKIESSTRRAFLVVHTPGHGMDRDSEAEDHEHRRDHNKSEDHRLSHLCIGYGHQGRQIALRKCRHLSLRFTHLPVSASRFDTLSESVVCKNDGFTIMRGCCSLPIQHTSRIWLFRLR